MPKINDGHVIKPVTEGTATAFIGRDSTDYYNALKKEILAANKNLYIEHTDDSLLRKFGTYLEGKGYRVVVLNFDEPYKSNAYNPFRYIRTDNDIAWLSKQIVNSSADTHDYESIRIKKAFLSAFMAYLFHYGNVEQKTMSNVILMLKARPNIVNELFEYVRIKDKTSFAVTQYDITQALTEREFNYYDAYCNGMLNLLEHLQVFTLNDIQQLTNSDTADIEEITSIRQTAIFVISSKRQNDILLKILRFQIMTPFLRLPTVNDTSADDETHESVLKTCRKMFGKSKNETDVNNDNTVYVDENGNVVSYNGNYEIHRLKIEKDTGLTLKNNGLCQDIYVATDTADNKFICLGSDRRELSKRVIQIKNGTRVPIEELPQYQRRTCIRPVLISMNVETSKLFPDEFNTMTDKANRIGADIFIRFASKNMVRDVFGDEMIELVMSKFKEIAGNTGYSTSSKTFREMMTSDTSIKGYPEYYFSKSRSEKINLLFGIQMRTKYTEWTPHDVVKISDNNPETLVEAGNIDATGTEKTEKQTSRTTKYPNSIIADSKDRAELEYEILKLINRFDGTDYQNMEGAPEKTRTIINLVVIAALYIKYFGDKTADKNQATFENVEALCSAAKPQHDEELLFSKSIVETPFEKIIEKVLLHPDTNSGQIKPIYETFKAISPIEKHSASFWATLLCKKIQTLDGNGNADGSKLNEIIKQYEPWKRFNSPIALKNELDKDVIGQEDAKVQVAMALFNHALSISAGRKKTHETTLLIGPSGCGKTETVKSAAKLLGIPYIVVDASQIAQDGFRGVNKDGIVKLVYENANPSHLAEYSVIVLDEFDKLCQPSHSNGGDNVSVLVQNSILSMLDGIPVKAGNDGAALKTENFLFFLTGAYTQLFEELRKEKTKSNAIGFAANITDNRDGVDKPLTNKEIIGENNEVFRDAMIRAGAIPELVGRVSNIVTLEKLTSDELFRAMTCPRENEIGKYRANLKASGKELVVEDSYIREIVERAENKGFGVRGCRNMLSEELRMAIYKAYEKNEDTVRLRGKKKDEEENAV